MIFIITMGASSKDKGNAWELEVAKFLEEHFEGKFSRVPRSGAMFGGENAENADGERQDVVEILGRLSREEGSSVLLVTHDLRLLKDADRVWEIDDGKVKLSDPNTHN